MPDIEVQTLSGQTASLGGAGWKMIVLYRGAHCPICKQYLTDLEGMKEAYNAEGIELIAVSADQADRAAPFISEIGFSSTVGVGLTIDQMTSLGAYISDPRSEKEAPAPFAEPALFVVNPDGAVQFMDKSNAPFVRPDLGKVLGGIKFVRENSYPIRGTH